MDLNTQEVHLSHYWNVVYKRWKVALAILCVVMVATLVASLLSKPLYRSAITVQIERENPNQLTLEDLFGIAASDQEFLQTQYVLLKSRGLAQRVIDENKLLADPDFNPAGIEGKSKDDLVKLRDANVDRVLGMVTVEPVKNTSLVEIAAIAGSPRLAQKVAEGWGASFIRLNMEKKFETVRQASDFLTRQIAEVKTALDETRARAQRYSESKDLVASDTAQGAADNVTVQKLLKSTSSLGEAQRERIAKQAAYQAILRANPESVAGNDTLVVQLTQQIAALNSEYNQKLAIFKPDHPQMQALRQQIDKTRQERTVAVAAAYAKAREQALNDLTAAQSQENSSQTALEEQKRETQKVSASAVQLVDLRSEIETKQALLGQLQKQLSETEVAARLRGANSSNVHWVDHAQLPAGRFNVTMKKNLQSAFPLGVLLGLAAIFFLEYMDRSVKSPEELEKVTRLASLGIIPAASSAGRSTYGYGRGANLRPVKDPEETQGIDLIPHLDSRSPISEAYRALRTSLLLSSANSPTVIVITSSFAREGKTTTAVNLATVLAQMGKPVLLIDGDLRRPRLQRVFRNLKNVGLVNYLAANEPLASVIQPTEVPNLSIIASGPVPPNPSELLGADRMKQLIHEVRTKFAYVIFDSPPVLAVTDAIVLASNADGVVLCVRGGHTPRELVARSADRLRQSNSRILGAMLNNLDLQQYGYAYKKSYYEYYGSDDEKGEPVSRERRAQRARR